MFRRPLTRLVRSVRAYSSTGDVTAAETSTKSKLPANSTSSYTPKVAPQSPNYPSTWTANQRPRPAAGSGPRFEQTDMELQPNPLSAMEMINNEPIRVVKGRKAVCDGGIGPLGHPKIFINLDKAGPHPCGYCGLRFEQDPSHGHNH